MFRNVELDKLCKKSKNYIPGDTFLAMILMIVKWTNWKKKLSKKN